MQTYIGMVSSDWSQCLSPSGPFDAFIFHYPQIESELGRVFQRYTANRMSLRQAADHVTRLLPAALNRDQMDAFLNARFETYRGVEKLIDWCHDHHILFMVNTTGFMGYFQRALAKGLLPRLNALSAQPMLRFGQGPLDPEVLIELSEIDDKAANSAAIAERFRIPSHTIVLLGDSGGDGPHFEWGARVGATLIGSMTKPSLSKFCHDRGISIDHQFGHSYTEGEAVSPDLERHVDFGDLIEILRQVLNIDPSSAAR